MSLVFSQVRKRYMMDWRDADGRRRSKTLWANATLEQAQRIYDRVRALAANPFTPLEKLEESLTRWKEEPPEYGQVYAVKNELLPGMYKIGKTTGPIHLRLTAFNTSHPVDWEAERVIRVTHMSAFEKALHEYFHPERVNPNREFFQVGADRLNAAFDLCLKMGDAEIRAKDLHRD